jgi:glutamyl-tRNA reductase
LLDLSIPKNVSDDVLDLQNVTLVKLDDLSKFNDDTNESIAVISKVFQL